MQAASSGFAAASCTAADAGERRQRSLAAPASRSRSASSSRRATFGGAGCRDRRCRSRGRRARGRRSSGFPSYTTTKRVVAVAHEQVEGVVGAGREASERLRGRRRVRAPRAHRCTSRPRERRLGSGARVGPVRERCEDAGVVHSEPGASGANVPGSQHVSAVPASERGRLGRAIQATRPGSPRPRSAASAKQRCKTIRVHIGGAVSAAGIGGGHERAGI